MKVIIAGSRTFNDYEKLKSYCDKVLSSQNNIEIVSGTATGADMLGERYAKEKNYSIKKFPADWDKYGKGAGYIRNKEMAEYSDALIAFWNGKSKGTKNMLELSRIKELPIRIFYFNNGKNRSK